MNFYVGRSLDELNISDDNIEFSDMLLQYLYRIRNHVDFNMKELYSIDPYGDTVITRQKIQRLHDICRQVLLHRLLAKYEAPEEGTESIQGLMKQCETALKNDMALISIGD